MLKCYKLEKESSQRKKKRGPSSSFNAKKVAEQIGCPQVEAHIGDNTINITALMGRLELYVEENKWKRTDSYTKRALYSATCQIEKMVKSRLLKYWN